MTELERLREENEHLRACAAPVMNVVLEAAARILRLHAYRVQVPLKIEQVNAFDRKSIELLDPSTIAELVDAVRQHLERP